MATPRVTRARSKTPLPAIAPKQSHAYGAQGKTDLKTQVRQGGEEMGAAFETARQASAAPEPSVEDDDGGEEAPSPPKKRGSSARIPRPRAESAMAERREADDAPPLARPARTIPDRLPTALDAGAGYGGPIRHGGAERYQPSKFRVFLRTIRKYPRALLQMANLSFKDLLIMSFFSICALISFMVVWAYVPLPSAMASVRDDFCWGLKVLFRVNPYDVPPAVLEERWYRFKHDLIFSKALPDHNMPDMQWAINVNFLQRIEKVEAKMRALEDNMSLHQDTMNMIQEMLPAHIVVRVVDGRYEIPEEFWYALRERLGEESDMAPLWKSYITRNEHEIEQLNTQLVSLSLDRAMNERQILTSAQFTQLMNENYQKLANQYQADFREMQQTYYADIRDLASKTALDVVAKSPAGQFAKEQLHNLIEANDLHNTFVSMRDVNFFNVGLGARIDPTLTSPTQRYESKTWLEAFVRKITPGTLVARPPIAALESWEEATDCWCATVEKEGYAQITVITHKKIYPQRLIVEHIPPSGTTDIKSAPREIEVWVEVTNEQRAKETAAWIAENDRGHNLKRPCGRAPSKRHVCVGSDFYDIHNHNWIQPIHLNSNSDEIGLGVNKVTVRATSNWGESYTCFYRLRMGGSAAVEQSP